MTISQDEMREQVKAELREALAYFIERQKLVEQAMIEFGLDLNEVGEFGSFGWLSSDFMIMEPGYEDEYQRKIAEADDPKIKRLLQAMLRATTREKISPWGTWRDGENNEWAYYLHGAGCRLTNEKTGEVIDWDCPDVNRYDTWKFVQHLRWQLSSPERKRSLFWTNIWIDEYLIAALDEIANEVRSV